MSKIDDSIASVAYILDSLRALRDIYDSGDCNNCDDMNRCKFVPEPGHLVRYNCPFYINKEVKTNVKRENMERI